MRCFFLIVFNSIGNVTNKHLLRFAPCQRGSGFNKFSAYRTGLWCDIPATSMDLPDMTYDTLQEFRRLYNIFAWRPFFLGIFKNSENFGRVGGGVRLLKCLMPPLSPPPPPTHTHTQTQLHTPSPSPSPPVNKSSFILYFKYKT